MPRTKQFDEAEVLQRAIRLFWKQGFHATSVQDLVDALGINRASLYDTFGSKEQLFERAFREYRAQNRAAILQFLQQQPTVKEGLHNLFRQAVRDAVQDREAKGCFVVNTTTELIPGDDWIRESLSANQREFTAFFQEYLQSGVESGEIAPGKDLHAIAALLFTLYNGIKVVAKASPDEAMLTASVEAALQVLE